MRVQSRLTEQTNECTNERIRLPFDCRVHAHTNMQHATKYKKKKLAARNRQCEVANKNTNQLKVFIVPHIAASKQDSQSAGYLQPWNGTITANVKDMQIRRTKVRAQSKCKYGKVKNGACQL